MASGYVRQSIQIFAREPVSRVLSSASLRLCGHSSRRRVAPPLKQPTRAASRNLPICRPYSVLHPVGFTVPVTLPPPRCALAAPFRPYPPESERYAFCGTVPEPPRSEARRALPGTVVPWSPDFPRASCEARGRPALWPLEYRRTVPLLRVSQPMSAARSSAGLPVSAREGTQRRYAPARFRRASDRPRLRSPPHAPGSKPSGSRTPGE